MIRAKPEVDAGFEGSGCRSECGESGYSVVGSHEEGKVKVKVKLKVKVKVKVKVKLKVKVKVKVNGGMEETLAIG